MYPRHTIHNFGIHESPMLPTVDKMSIDQGLDLSSYMFTSFGAYFFYPLAPPPTSPLEIYFAALARVCLAHHRSYVEAIAQLLFVFGRGFSPPSASIGGIRTCWATATAREKWRRQQRRLVLEAHNTDAPALRVLLSAACSSPHP
jgi:hypothetical protein